MKTIETNINDSVIGTSYDLIKVNARKMSEILKEGVNIEDFIIKSSYTKEDNTNPPLEIYEYQNFFVLLDNDKYILLDGFRRLLFFNTPDIDIMVRVYDRRKLTNQQILKMLVMFNHTKFFGGIGHYFERGFALSLYKLFGINVKKIHFSMDGYLYKKDKTRGYSLESSSSADKNDRIKERITNPMFIEDMLFIQKMIDKNYMVNDIFGAIIYEFREKHPDTIINIDKFIEIGDKITSLKELHIKYEKYKDDQTFAKTIDVINKITPIYTNILNELVGDKVEKTLAECLEETKKMVESLKKNKELIKMTGNQNAYKIESEIINMIKNNQPIEFVCIIHPREIIENYSEKTKKISDYGFLNGVKYLGFTNKTFGRTELKIGIEKEGKEYVINHNYGDWHSYGKKYTTITLKYSPHHQSQNVDLFVKMDKSILK